MSGASTKFKDWTADKIWGMTAQAGYRTENILVEGRHYTDAETLKAIIAVEKNDPLLELDLAELQKQIEKLSWVKAARVERRMPDTLYVELEERVPIALWQRKKRLSLIDTTGAVVTDHKLGRFKDLPIVVGENAPQKAPAFLEILKAEPTIFERVEALTYVSNRRWDLTLKSGVTVKLPEEEVSLALARLSKTQDNENIMDKDIKVIDVRETDRIIVQMKPGAVQEYSHVNLTSSGDQI